MKLLFKSLQHVYSRPLGITLTALVGLTGCVVGGSPNSPLEGSTPTPTPSVASPLENSNLNTPSTPSIPSLATTWRTPGITNGQIYSAAGKNSKLYIAGEFTYYGSPNLKGAAIVDATTGLRPTAVNSWPNFFSEGLIFETGTGIIMTAIADPNEAGAFFVGGFFSHVDGVPQSNLARIKPDGTLDTNWSGGTVGANMNNREGVVYSLATDGTSLFVAGGFNQVSDAIGTHSSSYLAKFSATTGLIQTGFTSALTDDGGYGSAQAVALFPGGKVAVGGQFTCGSTCYNYAVIDESTGAVTADGGPGADSTVLAIVATTDKVFVGGYFTSFMGNPAISLAVVDATNPSVFLNAIDTVQQWGWGASNGSVFSLAADSTHCYVTGYFNTLAGTPAQSPARMSLSYTVPSPTPTASPTVSPTASPTSSPTATPTPTPTPTATPTPTVISDLVDMNWIPNVARSDGNNPQVYSVHVTATQVFLGGGFDEVNGEPRLNLAAVDKVTGTSTDPFIFDAFSSSDWGRSVIAQSGNRLFTGGTITSTGGILRSNIMEIDLVTGQPTEWMPYLNNSGIYKIAIAGNLLYIWGDFSTVDGRPRAAGMAAFDLTIGTPLLTNWNPSPVVGGSIRDFEVSSTAIYVYGDFTSIRGKTRAGLAAFPHGSNTPNNWAPTTDAPLGNWFPMSHMNAYADSVYLRGEFTEVNGVPRAGAAEVDTITGALKPWNPTLATGYATALARAGGRVVVGGIDFNTFGQYLIATDPTTGADLGILTPPSPAPTPTGTPTPTPSNSSFPVIMDIDVIGDHAYVSGNLGAITGNDTQYGIARLNASDLSVSSWTPSINTLPQGVFTIDGDPNESLFAIGVGWHSTYTQGVPNAVGGVLRFKVSDGTWMPPE